MKYLSALGVAYIVKAHAQTNTKEVYLTFDDGPIDATEGVLDVLKATDTKVTFFLNGFHLFGEGDENEDRALEFLKRTVEEGHVIANHSYNHMLHNCCREEDECGAVVCNEIGMWNVKAYQHVEDDSQLFHFNTQIIRQMLKGELNGKTAPNDMMDSLGRLPYTNSWRIRGLNSDCACCTTDDVPPWDETLVCSLDDPTFSAAVSGIVADELKASGMKIYGWNIEWGPEDWGAADPAASLTSAEDLSDNVMEFAATDACSLHEEKEIVSVCNSSAHQGKVVILTHDFLFEDGKRGQGATANLPKLRDFIDIMRDNGFVFKTLDHYFGSAKNTRKQNKPESIEVSGKSAKRRLLRE